MSIKSGLVCLLLLVCTVAFSQTRYWVASTPGNWNDVNNWSATSGGAGGASVPTGAGGRAVFDGAGGANGNCTVDIAIMLQEITSTAGYTGTIFQNGNVISLIAGGAPAIANPAILDISGGTFSGDNADISVNGTFTVGPGATFISTQTDFTIAWHITIDNTASFQHNNGRVRLSHTPNMDPNLTGTFTCYDLSFVSGWLKTYTLVNGDVITVENLLEQTGTQPQVTAGAGEVRILGDVILNIGFPGDANFRFNSVGLQTCTGMVGGSILPNVTIDKAPGDDVNFQNTIVFRGSYFTHIAGDIIGNGRLVFDKGKAINGTFPIPNTFIVWFQGSVGPSITYYSFSGDVTILGNVFTLGNNAACLFNGPGRLLLEGDATFRDTLDLRAQNPLLGNGEIVITGTNDQLITGGTKLFAGMLPNLTIDKTGGTVTFKDTINVSRDFTYVQGNYDNLTQNGVFGFYNDGYFIYANNGFGSDFVFNKMVIPHFKKRRILGTNAIVDTSVNLISGQLDLNSKRLILKYPEPGALLSDDTLGMIYSETYPPPGPGYGWVDWLLGTPTPGKVYRIPFGNPGTGPTREYLPFWFEIQNGGTGANGIMSFATYRTDWTALPNNRPWPTGVTNLDNILGADNFTREVDRFWILRDSNYTTAPVTDLTFTYLFREFAYANNNILENILQAHQWDIPSNPLVWSPPSGTVDTIPNTVTTTGISYYSPFTLFDPRLPDLEISATDTMICVGDTIDFFDENDIAPNSYLWIFPGGTPGTSTDANPTDIVYNTPGTYDVILEAVYPQATLRDTFVDYITVNNGPSVSATPVDIDCFNGTGSVTFNIFGGSGSYAYEWNDIGVVGSPDRSGLSQGTYTISVTDVGQGCIVERSFTFTNPPQLTSSVAATKAITCSGGSDGEATVTASGGTPPYTYQWDANAGNQATATATGLAAGNYAVSVYDSKNCLSIASITMLNPSALVATGGIVQSISCSGGNDGQAIANVSGGLAPYNYSWPASANSQTTQIATNLLAGTYIATVEDSKGCSDTASVTLTDPPAFSATAAVTSNYNGSDISCVGATDGSATATPTGGTPGYTYLWDSNAGNQVTATATGLGAGNYVVTVTDGNSCTTTANVTLTAPAAISATVQVTSNFNGQDVTCIGASNGEATATGGGGTPGYTYAWDAAAGNQLTAIATGLGAGTYVVTVTDMNNCTDTASVTLTEPTAVSASAVVSSNFNGSDITCNGATTGEATASGSGGTPGYTYTWDANAGGQSTAVATSLGAGTYIVTVTDLNNCTDTASVTLTEPTVVTVVMDSIKQVSCSGANDGRFCADVTGGTPPYTYNWSNGGTGECITNLAPGTYSVTVTDANGCSAATSGNDSLATPTPFSATITSQVNVGCFGDTTGSACVTPNGGTAPFTYLWPSTAGSSTDSCVINLSAGTYNVKVTDAGGCVTFTPVTITQPALLQLSISSTKDVSCNGGADGEACATPTGGTAPYTFIWDVAAGSQTDSCATGLAVGNYTVTVTDANGCTDTTMVTISEPAVLDVIIDNANTTDISCNGGTDGIACVDVTGGTPPYTYNWSNGGTTQCITGLSAGTYTVTVTDANGCTDSIVGGITIVEPPLLVVDIDTANTSNVSCNGDADGEICVNVSGGTSPYTYSWSNGATTVCITSLPAGNYDVTVTDASGCTATITGGIGITITEPPVLEATIDTANTVNISCNGDADGTACVSVSGGTPPYTYLWSNSATDSCITNLGPGTYGVTVTDANGCQDSIAGGIVITEPAVLSAVMDTATTMDISCNGGTDGQACVAVSGGTPPYTYLWSNSATDSCISGLNAGTYTVTVTDANGCVDSVVGGITIIDPPVLVAANDTANTMDISCNGGTDGQACVSVTGGTPPYTYIWNNSATDSCISGLTAGTYTVTVTDANGCTDSIVGGITIAEPPALVVSIDTANTIDISCNGDTDGQACVSVSGGTPPYTYLWSNGITDSCITNLGAGTYGITVTDAAGCSDSIAGGITITEPPLLEASTDTTNTINVSCNGDTDGQACVSVTGGTPPYTYLWSNSATDSCISNLGAGTYGVTVTDANGCVDSITGGIIITEPPVLVAVEDTTGSSDISCNGGTDGIACVDVTGGTPPYTYNWSNGGTTQCITGLSAGTYTVTVTDANGCTDSIVGGITIVEPPLLVVDIDTANTSNVSCNGDADGEICVNVSGGTSPYTYSWSNGATTVCITSLPAGNYDVTVTDASGCTATITGGIGITITEPPVLEATIDTANTVNISCNGDADGTACVSVSGGTPPYTYLWSNSATDSCITNLGPGTYGVTVTDANGCQDSIAGGIVITEPAVLSAVMDTATTMDISCNGGTDGQACVAVSGGTPPYTYLWSNSATDSCISGLNAGTYTVTVTDANGCVDSVVGGITIIDPPVLVAANDTANTMDISCNGGTDGQACVSVTGGTPPYTYIWNNSATDSCITGLTAGTYSVTVTDANGCQDSIVGGVTTVEPPALIVSIDTANTSNVSCNGDTDGQACVSVSGGTPPYTYLWSNSATDSCISNLAAGTYDATVTDANGCTATITGGSGVIITEPPVLEVAIDTANTINISCNGDTDGQACVSVSGGTPPYTYLWSNAVTDSCITNLAAGTYGVTVTDANGCVDSIAGGIIITEPPVLVAVEDTTGSSNISCNGGTDGIACVDVTGGTPPYTYNWSNGGTTQCITGLTAGSYTVTVTDANGCQDSIVGGVTIIEPPLLVVNVDSSNIVNVLCNGDATGAVCAVVSGGTPPYTYAWSNGATDSCIINLTAGTYDVTVTDASGCTATLVSGSGINITEPPVLDVTLQSKQDLLCNGDVNGEACMIASGGTPPYVYQWDPNANLQTDSCAINLPAGTFFVLVTDANGCQDTASVTILEPAVLTSSITDTSHISCFGADDGSATVTPVGGTAPYTFAWNPGGQTDSTATGLTPGTYTVVVTDANGCTDSSSVTINEPDTLVATITGVNSLDVLCNGDSTGSATVTHTGGTGPYTYLWDPGAGSQVTATATNLPAGTFGVLVTDANGCIDTAIVTLTQPLAPLAVSTTTTDVTCFGGNDGTAAATASGGTTPYGYSWTCGITTAPDMVGFLTATGPSDLCTVMVTDSNGCTVIDTFTIDEPDEIVLTIAADSNANCNGGANGGLTVSVAGGTGPFDYFWSTNDSTIDGGVSNSIAGLAVGTYTVTVVDSNGCQKLVAGQIIERNGPSINLAGFNSTPTTCNVNNGTATVSFTTSNPPLSYAWSHDTTLNSATATGLNNQTYMVTVSDATTCDTVVMISVSQISALEIDTLIVKESFCDQLDGKATIIIADGIPPYTYAWSHDTLLTDSIADNLIPGFYSVTVTDANNCDTTMSFDIVDLEAPDVEIDQMSPIVAWPDQPVTLSGTLLTTDSVTYSWEQAYNVSCADCDTTIASVPVTTTIRLVATDNYTGCADTSYATIIIKDEQTILIPNVITPNGDGINDTWVIRDLEFFLDNEMVIVNRWGDEVFSAKPYNNDWGGTYNGNLLPQGTYYYILKLNDIDEVLNGTITILK